MIWRVRDRETFRRLAGASRRHKGPVGLAFVSGSSGPPRVAYSVSRRVGNAVERNRLRRRLREAVRRVPGGLVPGGAYLVSVGAGGRDLSFSRLCRAVGTLIGEAPGPR